MRNSNKSWTSYAALVVGIGAVVASLAVTSTPAGQGLTLGFGAFIVLFALLSLLVRDQTPDHWGLVVVGLALVIVPWLGAGFAPDPGAAWTAWVAGFLAMTLGGIGWLRGSPPTVYGIEGYGSRDVKPGRFSLWISRAALVVGLVTVVLGATVMGSSSASIAVTVGAGAFMAVIALWSLLAADPTHDYWTLAIVGFALFLAPFVAGITGEAAAWTAWVAGSIATLLGVTGYLRGESLDVASTVRERAHASYRERFRGGANSDGRCASQ
jgi:MFS family permease